MSASPHQSESLDQKITRMKGDLLRKENYLAQIETIGQSNSGGGMSTTYASRENLVREIAALRALIESFVAQLNGTPAVQPGVALLAYRGEIPAYSFPPPGS